MPRPWSERADELQATEGPYCDFAAWEEWADERGLFDIDLSSACDRTELYAAMRELADAAGGTDD